MWGFFLFKFLEKFNVNLDTSEWGEVATCNMCLSVYIPLRKQCQAVEGQEWDQAMSSSSEKDEDIEKTPDSDSLLACYK